jgi:TetR/AcrR family transcriptional regulator, transcriptional repressor for nem operon
MRKSKEITAESRKRIVTSASRMLRARGLEGTSLADVMHAAGMTHGGFYKHFGSKDELSDLATRAAFAEMAERFDARMQREGREKARQVYFAEYLSTQHVENPQNGCPVAAFGADAGRRPSALAAAFADGAEMLISRVASNDSAASRAEAIKKLVLVVGAVVVARSVGAGALRDEILAACADL